MRDKTFCTEENLKKYLENKDSFSLEDQRQLKYFVDNYPDCWQVWSKVRWDAAMQSEGVKELQEFLGDEFVPYYDSSWELAKEWNSKERATQLDVEDFYRGTKNYLYNSTLFYYSHDRVDLHTHWLELKERFGINSVIDFGCGVGNDGLKMLESGVKVIFSDFQSPSLDFLRWRLSKRKVEAQAEVLDLGKLYKERPKADMLWAVDVLEHMTNLLDIFKLVEEIPIVVLYTDSDDAAGGRHPFHFPVDKLQLDKEFSQRGYRKVEYEKLDVWERIQPQ